jgi:hypothetical protein
LRLELIKNGFQTCECVRAKLSWNDPQVSCVSLFLKEMNNHTGVVASEYDIARGLFDAFTKCFVPDESRVYAVLSYPFPVEYKSILEELQKSSLEFLTEKEAARKRGLLTRLQYWRLGSRTLYVRDAKRRDLSCWYGESESWTMTCFKFLVSPVALPNWIDDLARVNIGTIDKDFLRREGRVIYNCFEHGMELVGLDESTASVQVAAEELSRKFNVPLRVVESRE